MAISTIRSLRYIVTCTRIRAQFSDKFNINGRFITILRILRHSFYLVGAITSKFFMYPANISFTVNDNQLSDKFNNDWKKLKWLIYWEFSHFTFLILPCGHDSDVTPNNQHWKLYIQLESSDRE